MTARKRVKATIPDETAPQPTTIYIRRDLLIRLRDEVGRRKRERRSASMSEVVNELLARHLPGDEAERPGRGRRKPRARPPR